MVRGFLELARLQRHLTQIELRAMAEVAAVRFQLTEGARRPVQQLRAPKAEAQVFVDERIARALEFQALVFSDRLGK